MQLSSYWTLALFGSILFLKMLLFPWNLFFNRLLSHFSVQITHIMSVIGYVLPVRNTSLFQYSRSLDSINGSEKLGMCSGTIGCIPVHRDLQAIIWCVFMHGYVHGAFDPDKMAFGSKMFAQPYTKRYSFTWSIFPPMSLIV